MVDDNPQKEPRNTPQAEICFIKFLSASTQKTVFKIHSDDL